MEKPIVLKQRFRFSWTYMALLALQVGLVIWGSFSDSFAIWFWLPYFVLMSASVFFARVRLERGQIIVQNSLTDTSRHRFVRIVHYMVKPYGDRLDVELTVEQVWPQNSELFGIEFSFKRKPPSIQERRFSFSIELSQAETLMTYLHAQGAVGDVLAETDWRKLQIMLASSREFRRLKKERGRLSGAEMKEILQRTEAKLLEAEKEL